MLDPAHVDEHAAVDRISGGAVPPRADRNAEIVLLRKFKATPCVLEHLAKNDQLRKFLDGKQQHLAIAMIGGVGRQHDRSPDGKLKVLEVLGVKALIEGGWLLRAQGPESRRIFRAEEQIDRGQRVPAGYP